MCDMVCDTLYSPMIKWRSFCCHTMSHTPCHTFCQACRTFGTFLLVHQTKVLKLLAVRRYLTDAGSKNTSHFVENRLNNVCRYEFLLFFLNHFSILLYYSYALCLQSFERLHAVFQKCHVAF